MKYIKLIIIVCLLLPAICQNAVARPVIADLSLRQIEIDSGFKGTEILLFGARNDAGDIVVVIRGPESSYIVRKKERVAGIWMNKQQATFNNTHGFYNVSSSRPMEEIKNDYLLASLEIGVENIVFPIEAEEGIDTVEFQKAFLERKQQNSLYFPVIGDVSFIGDTLFRTIIKFPDNIPRGTYTAEVYLFSDGQLSGVQSTPLLVKKKGFDAFVFDFAYSYPALYGILAVIIALVAGWLAGAIFRKV